MYAHTDEPYLEVADDFFSKVAEDDFQAMCDRMLAAHSEMGSDKFIQLMAAQLIANPEAAAAVVRALQSAGVYAPKFWMGDDELIDVDLPELTAMITSEVAKEAGAQAWDDRIRQAFLDDLPTIEQFIAVLERHEQLAVEAEQSGVRHAISVSKTFITSAEMSERLAYAKKALNVD